MQLNAKAAFKHQVYVYDIYQYYKRWKLNCCDYVVDILLAKLNTDHTIE